MPISTQWIPHLSENICRVLASIVGKTRRVLVLDLDNTLWGGVIGDDGLDGINLGNGDATGEAFLDFQRTILKLHERGIILAVSSKNEEINARLPFREHPDMLIDESHISVFKANWNDKPSNIRSIAEELSLGLSSLVFFDDNPMERDIVRKMIPGVAVPEVPNDPSLYSRVLLEAGYFDTLPYRVSST